MVRCTTGFGLRLSGEKMQPTYRELEKIVGHLNNVYNEMLEAMNEVNIALTKKNADAGKIKLNLSNAFYDLNEAKEKVKDPGESEPLNRT